MNTVTAIQPAAEKTEVAVAIPPGYMMNARGDLIQEHRVTEQEKLRNGLVLDLVQEAISLSEQLAALKQRALADIKDLVQIAADRYDVDLGGKKGNVTLRSYNGQYRIDRCYADQIRFSEEIEAAKELFGRCIDRWAEGAANEMRALVDRAFRAGKNNQIKTAELLNLLRTDITDPQWQRACEALRDSIEVCGSTVYVRFYQRVGEGNNYRMIPLDMAGV